MPYGTLSHTCNMDNTAIFLLSTEYLPALKSALDKYCAGTNARFNESKTELLLMKGTPYAHVPDFEIDPVSDGKPIRYLVADNQISKVVDLVSHVTWMQMTLHGRTLALAQFTLPKLNFIFAYMPTSATQVQHTARQLSQIAWGHRKPYLNPTVMAMPVNNGGFSFPHAGSTRRTILLKQAQKLARHFHFLTTPQRPGHSEVAVPDWVATLHHLRIEKATDRAKKGAMLLYKDVSPVEIGKVMLYPLIQCLPGRPPA
ncbi:hypothetical protein GGF43_004960 [Coemansia sp. RSA 2618]|nr:hypothetical protein GGF43_004960 [Coemansia sp. RSA 2618]